MKAPSTSKSQIRKVEQLHTQTNQWKSNLHFMNDEITFIKRLLNSYIFEPNTPNLFEKIQLYQAQLKKADQEEKRLLNRIAKHESDLGGMLECKDEICDMAYYQKHETLQAGVGECMQKFGRIKAEIFNYAGGILKKKKP